MGVFVFLCMVVFLREKSKNDEKVVVSLEEDVKGHRGLDLFIFDKGSVLKSQDGLEARLVYSPYVLSDAGCNLVKGIVHKTAGVVVKGGVREFTKADYLASVEGVDNVRMLLRVREDVEVFMDVKQASNVAVFSEIVNKLYASDGASQYLLFRYHPRCTRWWRFGLAGLAGVLGGVGVYDCGLSGLEGLGDCARYFSVMLGASTMAGIGVSVATRYLGPLFVSGKSMLVDIKNKQDEGLRYVKKVEDLKECLRLQEERNDGVFKYRRFTKKKNKMESRAADVVKAVVSMKSMYREIYQAVCELEGLHITYVEPVGKGFERMSYDDVRGVLLDIVPDSV